MWPDLKGLPIRIVFSAEIAFVTPTERKHKNAIIERIKPNFKFLIILPSFLDMLFFNLLDQFAVEIMIVRHQPAEVLRPRNRIDLQPCLSHS